MKTRLLIASGISIAALAIPLHQSTQAQNFPAPPQSCVFLKEVTTSQTAIRKVIRGDNSNANTDFVVPTGKRFVKYEGQFIPENNAGYTVEVNLKYPNNTSSQVINRKIDNARRFYLYRQGFRAPTTNQPYQVNARITGARNNAYRIAILACS